MAEGEDKTKVHNIVVTTDFGESINLEKIPKNCKMIYEPEQFPGGILRIEEPYKVSELSLILHIFLNLHPAL